MIGVTEDGAQDGERGSVGVDCAKGDGGWLDGW